MLTLEDRIKAKHNVQGDVGAKSVIAEMEVKDTTDRVLVTSIINTARVDLENEVVIPSGADLSYFNGTKSVFWQHEYSMLPVAECRNIALKKGVWVAQAAMSTHPFAVDLTTCIREGVVRGTSVGFKRLDVGPPTSEESKTYGTNVRQVTRSWLMLEYSFTGIPANGDALHQLVSAGKVARKSASFIRPDLITPERKSWPTTGPATKADASTEARRRWFFFLG